VYQVPCGSVFEFTIGDVTVHVSCTDPTDPAVEPPPVSGGGFGMMIRANFGLFALKWGV